MVTTASSPRISNGGDNGRWGGRRGGWNLHLMRLGVVSLFLLTTQEQPTFTAGFSAFAPAAVTSRRQRAASDGHQDQMNWPLKAAGHGSGDDESLSSASESPAWQHLAAEWRAMNGESVSRVPPNKNQQQQPQLWTASQQQQRPTNMGAPSSSMMSSISFLANQWASNQKEKEDQQQQHSAFHIQRGMTTAAPNNNTPQKNVQPRTFRAGGPAMQNVASAAPAAAPPEATKKQSLSMAELAKEWAAMHGNSQAERTKPTTTTGSTVPFFAASSKTEEAKTSTSGPTRVAFFTAPTPAAGPPFTAFAPPPPPAPKSVSKAPAVVRSAELAREWAAMNRGRDDANRASSIHQWSSALGAMTTTPLSSSDHQQDSATPMMGDLGPALESAFGNVMGDLGPALQSAGAAMTTRVFPMSLGRRNNNRRAAGVMLHASHQSSSAKPQQQQPPDAASWQDLAAQWSSLNGESIDQVKPNDRYQQTESTNPQMTTPDYPGGVAMNGASAPLQRTGAQASPSTSSVSSNHHVVGAPPPLPQTRAVPPQQEPNLEELEQQARELHRTNKEPTNSAAVSRESNKPNQQLASGRGASSVADLTQQWASMNRESEHNDNLRQPPPDMKKMDFFSSGMPPAPPAWTPPPSETDTAKKDSMASVVPPPRRQDERTTSPAVASNNNNNMASARDSPLETTRMQPDTRYGHQNNKNEAPPSSLAQEWTQMNRERTTGEGGRTAGPPLTWPAAVPRTPPATRPASLNSNNLPSPPTMPTASMPSLAEEWAAMNKERDNTSNQNTPGGSFSSEAFVKKTAPSAPSASSTVPSTKQDPPLPSPSSTRMNDLANEWATMNQDHDTSGSSSKTTGGMVDFNAWAPASSATAHSKSRTSSIPVDSREQVTTEESQPPQQEVVEAVTNVASPPEYHAGQVESTSAHNSQKPQSLPLQQVGEAVADVTSSPEHQGASTVSPQDSQPPPAQLSSDDDTNVQMGRPQHDLDEQKELAVAENESAPESSVPLGDVDDQAGEGATSNSDAESDRPHQTKISGTTFRSKPLKMETFPKQEETSQQGPATQRLYLDTVAAKQKTEAANDETEEQKTKPEQTEKKKSKPTKLYFGPGSGRAPSRRSFVERETIEPPPIMQDTGLLEEETIEFVDGVSKAQEEEIDLFLQAGLDPDAFAAGQGTGEQHSLLASAHSPTDEIEQKDKPKSKLLFGSTADQDARTEKRRLLDSSHQPPEDFDTLPPEQEEKASLQSPVGSSSALSTSDTSAAEQERAERERLFGTSHGTAAAEEERAERQRLFGSPTAGAAKTEPQKFFGTFEAATVDAERAERQRLFGSPESTGESTDEYEHGERQRLSESSQSIDATALEEERAERQRLFGRSTGATAAEEERAERQRLFGSSEIPDGNTLDEERAERQRLFGSHSAGRQPAAESTADQQVYNATLALSVDIDLESLTSEDTATIVGAIRATFGQGSPSSARNLDDPPFRRVTDVSYIGILDVGGKQKLGFWIAWMAYEDTSLDSFMERLNAKLAAAKLRKLPSEGNNDRKAKASKKKGRLAATSPARKGDDSSQEDLERLKEQAMAAFDARQKTAAMKTPYNVATDHVAAHAATYEDEAPTLDEEEEDDEDGEGGEEVELSADKAAEALVAEAEEKAKKAELARLKASAKAAFEARSNSNLFTPSHVDDSDPNSEEVRRAAQVRRAATQQAQLAEAAAFKAMAEAEEARVKAEEMKAAAARDKAAARFIKPKAKQMRPAAIGSGEENAGTTEFAQEATEGTDHPRDQANLALDAETPAVPHEAATDHTAVLPGLQDAEEAIPVIAETVSEDDEDNEDEVDLSADAEAEAMAAEAEEKAKRADLARLKAAAKAAFEARSSSDLFTPSYVDETDPNSEEVRRAAQVRRAAAQQAELAEAAAFKAAEEAEKARVKADEIKAVAEREKAAARFIKPKGAPPMEHGQPTTAKPAELLRPEADVKSKVESSSTPQALKQSTASSLDTPAPDKSPSVDEEVRKFQAAELARLRAEEEARAASEAAAKAAAEEEAREKFKAEERARLKASARANFERRQQSEQFEPSHAGMPDPYSPKRRQKMESEASSMGLFNATLALAVEADPHSLTDEDTSMIARIIRQTFGQGSIGSTDPPFRQVAEVVYIGIFDVQGSERLGYWVSWNAHKETSLDTFMERLNERLAELPFGRPVAKKPKKRKTKLKSNTPREEEGKARKDIFGVRAPHPDGGQGREGLFGVAASLDDERRVREELFGVGASQEDDRGVENKKRPSGEEVKKAEKRQAREEAIARLAEESRKAEEARLKAEADKKAEHERRKQEEFLRLSRKASITVSEGIPKADGETFEEQDREVNEAQKRKEEAAKKSKEILKAEQARVMAERAKEEEAEEVSALNAEAARKAEDERVAKEAFLKQVEKERMAKEAADEERRAEARKMADAAKKVDEERMAAEARAKDEAARKAKEEEAAEAAREEEMKAEEAAKSKQAEEERIMAEEKAEAARKAEEEKKAEEAAKAKAEEERIMAEKKAEAARKAEEERRKVEEAAKAKAEEERIVAEKKAEAARKAEEERRQAEEAAKAKAEEERIMTEKKAAAARKAEEEARKLEEEAVRSQNQAEERRVMTVFCKAEMEEKAEAKKHEKELRAEAEAKKRAENSRLAQETRLKAEEAARTRKWSDRERSVAPSDMQRSAVSKAHARPSTQTKSTVKGFPLKTEFPFKPVDSSNQPQEVAPEEDPVKPFATRRPAQTRFMKAEHTRVQGKGTAETETPLDSLSAKKKRSLKLRETATTEQSSLKDFNATLSLAVDTLSNLLTPQDTAIIGQAIESTFGQGSADKTDFRQVSGVEYIGVHDVEDFKDQKLQYRISWSAFEETNLESFMERLNAELAQVLSSRESRTEEELRLKAEAKKKADIFRKAQESKAAEDARLAAAAAAAAAAEKREKEVRQRALLSAQLRAQAAATKRVSKQKEPPSKKSVRPDAQHKEPKNRGALGAIDDFLMLGDLSFFGMEKKKKKTSSKGK